MNRVALLLAFVVDPMSAPADEIDDKIEKIAKAMGGNNGVERDTSKKGRPVVVVKMQYARAIPVEVCKQLAELKSVQKIWFTGSPLTDAGVKELIPLGKTLQFIDLNGTKITSESLKHVAQMPNLYSLAVTDSAVGNENLKELQSLKKLTHLYLSRTKITADCFDDLATLKGIKEIYLVETKLKKEEVEELRKKMPQTRIIR